MDCMTHNQGGGDGAVMMRHGDKGRLDSLAGMVIPQVIMEVIAQCQWFCGPTPCRPYYHSYGTEPTGC